MVQAVTDFTDEEISTLQALVNRRCGVTTELLLGDSDFQSDPAQAEVVSCPVVFWSSLDCNFVLMRTGEDQYRAQYYYNPNDQFSTRQSVFTDIEDCASAVMREQSESERDSDKTKNTINVVDIN